MLKNLTVALIILLAFCWQKAYCDGGRLPKGISFKNAIVDDLDPEPYGDFKMITIPIKRAGNLIVIEAKVDTVEGNFILDTGAPYLVLNQTYFRDAPRFSEPEAGGINGRSANSFSTIVRSFAINELRYDRLRADVTDLSNIENGRGLKILGLLGTRLFSKLAITVDLFNNVLYIHKLNKEGGIIEGDQLNHQPFMSAPFRLINDVIFLKGTVNNSSLWFAFDTGAETNLLDFRAAKKLMSTMQIINRQKLTGIGGTAFEVIYAQFDQLMVGDRMYMKNRIVITNLEAMGKAYGSTVEGMLGYDFFVRGIFSINFVKKEFNMYTYNYQ